MAATQDVSGAVPDGRSITSFRSPAEQLPLDAAAGRLHDVGFLAGPDLPDRPGPAYLLVAIRDHPAARHDEPERVEFWMSRKGRGVRRTLTRATPLPLDAEFSWGLIRLVDRLEESNEYLTFGGHLSAATVDDAAVAVFRSPVPLLRRGGHSQLWDDGADQVGAFFGRLAATATTDPALEAAVCGVDELARYSAFLADVAARYRGSRALCASNADVWAILRTEADRMRDEHPEAWQEGIRLLATMREATDRRA